MRTFNAIAANALKVAIAAWVLLGFAALFLMTLGTDEAWVLNGLRSLLHPPVQNLSTELIVTSGGVFALLNLAVEWMVGSHIWIHRLLSFLALGGVFALVLRRLRMKGRPSTVQWLTLTPLVALPGTIEVGTAALGTSIGLFLMMASMIVWTAAELPLRKRVVYGGLLFGLAAASRFDLVLFGAAVFLVSCICRASETRVNFRFSFPAFTFICIGMGVFFLNQWIMRQPVNAMAVANIGAATGLNGWSFDYPKLLNQWMTLSTYSPLALLALLLMGGFWLPPAPVTSFYPDVPRFETLLAVTGIVLLAAWLFRAPIAHLRYAFPALFCFATLGAIALQRLAVHAIFDNSERRWLMCQFLGLALLVGSIGNTTRSLVMSDSDYASWEWTHEMPYDYFRRFEAQQQQTEIAAFLRSELSPDARVYSHVPYALRYLAKRPIVAIDLLQETDPKVIWDNRYLVLTPATGTYFYLNNTAANWLGENAKLIKQFGRYSVYQLPVGSDLDLEVIKLRRSNYEKHPGSSRWFGR